MAKVELLLEHIFKRYDREWIIKDFSYRFSNEKVYALTGPNGSGKTTLIEILSSYLTPSKGNMLLNIDGKGIKTEQVYEKVSASTPAMSLVEEMKLGEMLKFHFRFKKPDRSLNSIIEILNFNQQTQIRNYSSGMKQRLKLALAFFSKSSLLLLDEPTTNLDEKGFNWFESLLHNNRNDRLTIISSNLQREIDLCDEVVPVSEVYA